MANIARLKGRNTSAKVRPHRGWYIVFGICVLYSLYALSMAAVAIAELLGLASDAPDRSVPTVFVIHALSGAVVLVSGALQFNQQLRVKNKTLHRVVGRVYVGMVWLSSIGGLWLALFFDVGLAAQAIFIVLAILWFTSTTRAFQFARKGNFKSHRAWMFRSFALSFFFVTFSIWVDGMAAFLPESVAYPTAVFISWSLNLVIAEVYIRRTRSHTTVRP